MPERIEAVLQLRELGRRITTISLGEPRVLKEIAMSQDRRMQDRRRTSDSRPCAYPDIDPAKVFSGGGDRVLEREKLDLDCAECGTQAAQFSWPQILGEGYFVSTVGRDEETIRTYIKNQEIADKQFGSVATEARVLIKSRLLYQNPS
jgi:hypothetical protein